MKETNSADYLVPEKYQLNNIDKNNFIKRVRPLLGNGWYINFDDNKLTQLLQAQAADTPWNYVRINNDFNCVLWRKVIFECFGFIAKGCLSCYKVVVKPRTVKELIAVMEYQENVYLGDCKCGTEKRGHVFGNYGAYFYNKTLDEGFDCLSTVREYIGSCIDPDIPVYLKRGCTELELRFGSSEVWDKLRTQDHDRVEELITSRSNVVTDHRQSKDIKNHVIEGWIKYAWKHGDRTALEFNGGKNLYTPCLTYEEMQNDNENNGGIEA